MDIEKLKYFLNQVKLLSKHYEQIAAMSGENFNVFKILNLESSEVRLHSSMLAEFLNPKGSHGQGDLFLKLFTKQFGINNFDTKTAHAEVEKNIGLINSEYTEGGRIDILITDGNEVHIIIENKIYAGDQKNQLLRYYNFDTKAKLFYLTLQGDEPSKESTANIVTPDKYTAISYSMDIIDWLENCKKEAVSLPIIRETIVQYINLIKVLTNQTTKEAMKDEIKQFLFDDPEYLDLIDLSRDVINSIVNETKEKFIAIRNELFPKVTIVIVNDLSIMIQCNEDGDGVFVGYSLLKNNENYNTSIEAQKYINELKEIYSEMHSSPMYVGWYNPIPFERHMKFEDLNKKEVFKMAKDESYMRAFIQQIVEQEKKIRIAFFEKVKDF